MAGSGPQALTQSESIEQLDAHVAEASTGAPPLLLPPLLLLLALLPPPLELPLPELPLLLLAELPPEDEALPAPLASRPPPSSPGQSPAVTACPALHAANVEAVTKHARSAFTAPDAMTPILFSEAHPGKLPASPYRELPYC